MLFYRVKSVVTDNHYLLIASNPVLTSAVTYFHNLIFSNSFRVIFNYSRIQDPVPLPLPHICSAQLSFTGSI